MYTLYEYPKCSTCRKARADLTKLQLDFKSIDIKTNPPKATDILHWMDDTDYTLKNFFNTSGQSYRTLGLKNKIDSLAPSEAAELLASDGMLIKRPILIKDGRVLQIGYRTPYEDLHL